MSLSGTITSRYVLKHDLLWEFSNSIKFYSYHYNAIGHKQCSLLQTPCRSLWHITYSRNIPGLFIIQICNFYIIVLNNIFTNKESISHVFWEHTIDVKVKERPQQNIQLRQGESSIQVNKKQQPMYGNNRPSLIRYVY